MMEVVLGVALLAAIPIGIVAFVVSEWRRSEREQQPWQSRRSVDEAPRGEGDRGAYRAHWGGMGRPGGGGR